VSSSAGVAKPKIAGLISEKDFKALHALKGDAAPAPRGEMIDLAGSKAYLSLPKVAKPPLPAIVVIHEWWGLNGHIKHWADRLTEDGYATLAVDLYGGEVATDPDGAMKLMKAVEAEAARKTLLAAFELLGSDPRIKAEKRASIGWCFGGKWSLELALAAPKLSAAVVYYGFVETDPERLATLEAPLLGIFAERDKSIDAKYVDKFKFGLEQAGGKDTKILTYPADHAFANPSSERYDFESADKAWQQARGFLGKHLKGPG
jgi:carboxymethylenebutenolidase